MLLSNLAGIVGFPEPSSCSIIQTFTCLCSGEPGWAERAFGREMINYSVIL